MKKIIFVAIVALLLFSCEEEPEETGPFSLIGTWVTEGEYVVNGDQRNYKSTLIFLNETKYKQEAEFKSKNGTWNLKYNNDGTYTYSENIITYTDTYYKTDGSKGGGPFVYKRPYKFINKDTLEASVPGVQDDIYIKDVVYKRK